MANTKLIETFRLSVSRSMPWSSPKEVPKTLGAFPNSWATDTREREKKRTSYSVSGFLGFEAVSLFIPEVTSTAS